MPDNSNLEILYDDNHLLALNKPAGLLTQPSGRPDDSLEAQAKAWIKQSKSKPGDVFLHAVHRLDKPVSGIALFARTSKALSRMNEAMRAHEIAKFYHCVITDDLPAEQGTLMHHLRHSRMRSIVASQGDYGAQESLLTYRIVNRHRGMVLVEILLHTGRYHQIRSQLAATGCPILGDALYGGRQWNFPGCIALHHRRMAFSHPTLRSPISIEAPYPAAYWPAFA